MFDHVSHVAIAVPDLEAARRLCRDVYGLPISEISENRDQKIRMFHVTLEGRTGVEIMAPTQPDSPIGKFLQRNPSGGIHHISFGVSDLDESLGALGVAGVSPLGGASSKNVFGQKMAFLHPKNFLGVLVELEESSHE